MPRVCVLLAVAVLIAVVGFIDDPQPVTAHNGSAGCPLRPPQDLPDGLLIRPVSSGTQYLLEDCGRRPIADWRDLESHRFPEVADVITDQEAASIGIGPTLRSRVGTLYRNPDGGIYAIDEISPGNYRKRHVTAYGWSTWYTSCGYTQSHTVQLSDYSFLNTYSNGSAIDGARPNGQLIKTPNTDPVYLLIGGYKQWIDTWEAFLSYNFQYPICVTDVGAFPTGFVMKAREGTRYKHGCSAAQYVIDRVGPSYYRRLLTWTAPSFYGLVSNPPCWPTTVSFSYSDLVHAHAIKQVWPYNWDENLTTNDLGVNVIYGDGASPGSWDTPIGLAEGAWNSRAINPDFVPEPGNFIADLRIVVQDFPDWPPDQGGYTAPSLSGSTVNFMFVYIQDFMESPNQSIVAHELGHTLLLAHDGINPDTNGDGLEEKDFRCGDHADGVFRVPATIMDYDCYPGTTTGPLSWDDCGVNHLYGGNTSGC